VAKGNEDETGIDGFENRRRTDGANIRRKTRREYAAEEMIRIVLSGLRGKGRIAELCRQEGIA